MAERRKRTRTVRDPMGCRCGEGWPVLHVAHLGEGEYEPTRRHDMARCGLLPEPTELERRCARD